MANKIVQLQDEEGNAVFPIAGGVSGGSITNSSIADGTITADKINMSTLIETVGTTTGTNINYCIKIADGTMIAVIKKEFTGVNITSAWGGTYEYEFSSSWLGNFAVEFVEKPALSIYATGGNSAFWVTNEPTDMTTKRPGAFGLLRGSSRTGAAGTINVIAIGRWK